MTPIRSIQIEKHVLAGFLKYPQVYFEVSHFINEADFSQGHQTIFRVIKGQISQNLPLDPVIIAEKIKNLGINFKHDFNVFDYIESLSFLKISQKSLVDACKGLKTVTIRREIAETSAQIAEAMDKSGDRSPDEIISTADKMYNERISAYDLEASPEDLFQDIAELIESRANNPVAETGYLTPYKLFNKMYGGLRPGELYAWVSRPKHGKQLSVSTPVYTTNGWKNHGDLQKGDYVFHPSGKPVKVLAYIPQGQPCTLEVELSNHLKIKCHENHEWTVLKDGKLQTLETKKLLTQKLYTGVRGKRGSNFSFKLPAKKSLDFPRKDLSIDPHWFGYWLGNGKTDSPCLTIINSDNYLPSTWPYKVSTINSNGVNNDSLHYNFFKQGLGEQLKMILNGQSKYIPIEYLTSSKEQRLELLAGLIDSDGHLTQKSGQYRFCNANKQLVDDVCTLVSSLGWNYSITSVAPCLSSSGIQGKLTNYQVGFVPSEAIPCRVKRKQSSRFIKGLAVSIMAVRKLSENEYEKGNCIMVDSEDGLYLAGEKMVPTHNSTILSDICAKATLINPNLQALILDTEMQTDVIKFRIASSITGIPMWWLETGNFKNNQELLAKWNSKKSELSKAQGKVKHLQVSGKPIAEIESIIQRWYLGQVGRGNPAIVVYDYIKLTGEFEKGKQEYQLIGDKVDRLKEISVRLNIPILTACQLNRSAEGGTDDSSAIAQSDRLQWFAAYVGIFRRKTLEEQAEDGAQFGTHKMIELASRYQGQHAHGHNDLVRVVQNNRPAYRKNFISFKVENFDVTETGTLQDIVNHQNGVNVNIFDRNNEEADADNNNGEDIL